MVVVEVDDLLTVEIVATESGRWVYTVHYDGDEITRYETSADPRTIGGRVGLRNVVCRHLEYDKEAVQDALSRRIDDHADALADEAGQR